MFSTIRPSDVRINLRGLYVLVAEDHVDVADVYRRGAEPCDATENQSGYWLELSQGEGVMEVTARGGGLQQY